MTETEARYYCDNNNLDNIEGIWINETGSRFFIRKNPDMGTNYRLKYLFILLESNWNPILFTGKMRDPGAIWGKIEKSDNPYYHPIRLTNSPYVFKDLTNYKKYHSDAILGTLFFYRKEFMRLTVSRKQVADLFKVYDGEINKGINTVATAYVIHKDGYLVTCFHVIDKATEIMVTNSESNYTKRYAAKVVLVDQQHDLALIKIVDKDMPPISSVPYCIRKSDVVSGEKTISLGYPAIDDLGTELKVAEGIVAASVSYKEYLFQSSADTYQGNSGGPIFDEYGNIIGTTSRGINGTRINFPIRNKSLIDMLSLFPLSFEEMPPIYTPKSLTEMVEERRPFIYKVYTKKQM